MTANDAFVDQANILTCREFLAFLAAIKARCPSCRSDDWATYRHDNNDERVQIFASRLISGITADRVMEVSDKMTPPRLAAHCKTCGHVAEFDLTKVVGYILEAKDHEQ